jgi:hypothetical protein
MAAYSGVEYTASMDGLFHIHNDSKGNSYARYFAHSRGFVANSLRQQYGTASRHTSRHDLQ